MGIITGSLSQNGDRLVTGIIIGGLSNGVNVVLVRELVTGGLSQNGDRLVTGIVRGGMLNGDRLVTGM